jgi:two-component system LytT family response regulator
MKTCIIDDEPDAIKALELIVRDFCPGLTIAGTAGYIEEAWELIKSAQPDLVLLDIEMPRGDGFNLLDRFPMRKFDVIFVTAHTKRTEKAQWYQAFSIMEKPVDIQLFQQTISRLKAHRDAQPDRVYKIRP